MRKLKTRIRALERLASNDNTLHNFAGIKPTCGKRRLTEGVQTTPMNLIKTILSKAKEMMEKSTEIGDSAKTIQ